MLAAPLTAGILSAACCVLISLHARLAFVVLFLILTVCLPVFLPVSIYPDVGYLSVDNMHGVFD